mgnify:CR=1 FL=1
MATDLPPSNEDQLGDYRLVRLIHENKDTLTYEACQISVDRTVALVELKRRRSEDSLAVQAFHDELRAKAAVSHPRIATVYEVCEEQGRLFYTREMVRGDDLVTLSAMERHLSLESVWDLVSTTCESFLYYQSKGLYHAPLRGESLVLIKDAPYLENLATAETVDQQFAFEASLPAFRNHLWPLLEPKDALVGDVQSFFARMDPQHDRHYSGWQDLQRACNIARKITSTPTVPTTPSVATTRVIHQIQSNQKSSVPMIALALLVLMTGGGVLWWSQFRSSASVVTNPLVAIPSLGFEMSKYEITIHEYHQFLESTLGKRLYDHSDQPREKRDHLPDDWQTYHPQAQQNGSYRGNPISLNSPVVGVDWWDAFAFAQWRGGRLPSTDEWLTAASGPMNFVYPWGNKADPSKANTGIDYTENAENGGLQDGANAWAAVDAPAGDISAFGLHGMSGNVSEWTATWGTDPNNPDRQVPIVKGASFLTKKNLELKYERFRPADKRSMDRGFRIVRDQ